jgi:hypothetical protein
MRSIRYTYYKNVAIAIASSCSCSVRISNVPKHLEEEEEEEEAEEAAEEEEGEGEGEGEGDRIRGCLLQIFKKKNKNIEFGVICFRSSRIPRPYAERFVFFSTPSRFSFPASAFSMELSWRSSDLLPVPKKMVMMGKRRRGGDGGIRGCIYASD